MGQARVRIRLDRRSKAQARVAVRGPQAFLMLRTVRSSLDEGLGKVREMTARLRSLAGDGLTAPTTPKIACLTLSLGLAMTAAACGAEDRALVSYTVFEEPGFTVDLFVIEFSDGRTVWRLIGDDFSDGAGSRHDTREFETKTSGELVTSFWMVQGRDTLSSGELRIDLRSDWRWNISFFRGSEDPSGTCFGCVGSAAHALDEVLRTVPADSIWLVWGGNSISNPVIF